MTEQEIDAIEERTKADLHYMPHECLFGMAINGWSVEVQRTGGITTTIARKVNREAIVINEYGGKSGRCLIPMLNALVVMVQKADDGHCD